LALKSKQVQKFPNSNNDGIPLGSLVENFDSKRIPISQLERKNGIIPYYGASGIIDHIDDYILNGEYLLVSEDGENLRSRNNPIAFLTEGKFWPNNHIHVLKANEKSTNHFLVNVLNYIKIDGYLTGTAQPKLNRKNLDLILIPNFSLEEQTKIGNIIHNLTKTIDNLQNQNYTLEQTAQAIFQSWFLDFDGVTEWDDSELGKIPKGWSVKNLDEIGTVITGKTPSTKEKENFGIDYPFITIPDMQNSVWITKTERYLSEHAKTKIQKYLLPMNSICVSCIATPGLVSLTTQNSFTNQQINSIICNDGISPFFIYQSMKLEKDKIIRLASGGTATLNLNKGDFSLINILLPTQIKLDDFHNFVSPIFKTIKNNLININSLTKTRDTLLPKLMSGEIRV
jgi:type I restriction enzyme, S subunit